MRPVPTPERPLLSRLTLVALTALALAGCRSGGTGSPGTSISGTPTRREAAPASPSPAPGSDVEKLASTDFVLRSQAAERLVAAGPAALDSLGAAGDMPVAVLGGGRDSATAPVVAAILAHLSDAEAQQLLQSPHPTLRRAAATELGRREAWAPVPALIEGLADADPGTREASHAALKRLTGELADPVGSGSRRDRWRAWWSQAGRLRAEGRRTPTSG